MTLAAFAKEIPIPQEQVFLFNAIGFAVVFISFFVFRKMLRTVGQRGGLVRSDLLGLPDTLVTGVLATMLLLLIMLQWITPPEQKPAPLPEVPAHTEQGLQIIYGALQFALPVAAILALLIGRGVSLMTLLGIWKMKLPRALAAAVGLVLVLIPAYLAVTLLAHRLLGDHAQPQELVKTFSDATKNGKSQVLWQVVVAAVIIAPLSEELLFRAYFYPAIKRVAGPVPAAVMISLLFGAIHNNALGMPGLTLFALVLTLAYEWSGSILVPVLMHAWFNAVNLLMMWWNTRHGVDL